MSNKSELTILRELLHAIESDDDSRIAVTARAIEPYIHLYFAEASMREHRSIKRPE